MRLLLTVLLAALPLAATTLEKLSFDEMVAKSTAIVRGRVTRSHVAQHGPIYYTHYRVAVTERFKGADTKSFDVVLPGGSIGRTQQTYSGTPVFADNSDLVLFLWTSRAGLTHVIGLSQGVFQPTPDSTGAITLTRGAIREGMVDPQTGRPVVEPGMRISMQDFTSRVRAVADESGRQGGARR